MRRAIRKLPLWIILSAAVCFAGGSLEARAATSDIKGIFLVADYPAVTVAAGESTTIDFNIDNYDEPPQQLALSLSGLPKGWKARFLGNNETIAAAMAATNKSVSAKLRIDVPEGATGAGADLVLHADGERERASLPLKIALGNSLPVSLSLKPELPSLTGTPTTSFSYTLDLRNDSGVDLLASLAAATPPDFQASYSKQYDTTQISSLPIKAGQTQNVTLKISPPNTVTAGTYHLMARVSGGGITATAPLSLEIVGQPKLTLGTKSGRLSGDAEAGAGAPIALVLRNTGSAPARNITLSGSPPENWKVSFTPSKLPELAPNATQAVQAVLTPSDKTVAGDYMASFSADSGGDDTNVNYRVTVTTSTLWGIVGIGLIAIALLVVVGAVARYGRR